MLRRSRLSSLCLAAVLAFTTSRLITAQSTRKVVSAPTVKAASHVSAAALMPASNPEVLGFDAQRLAKLDAYMAKAVADGRVAGMTTLLARHGQIVSEKAY